MSLVVVTGGARSGKSGVAQRLADSRGAHVTVAVFASPDSDSEMTRRIRRHHEDRSRGWGVVEPGTGSAWVSAVPAGDVLVLDCLGTLLGNMMLKEYEARGLGRFARAKHLPEDFEDGMEQALGDVVAALARRSGDSIIVTNEVGDGVVPTFATGRVFRDVLGRANRELVDLADAAYLVVAGRCVDLKELPRNAQWPDQDEGQS